MKRRLLFISLFICVLILSGCGSSKDTFTLHNKYDNALECNTVQGQSTSKLWLYFDKNDNLVSFDYYVTLVGESYTDEFVNTTRDNLCNGKGEFKKEWIEECTLEKVDDKVEAHLYLNSPEWFGEYKTKSRILNARSNELGGFNCKEKIV